MSRDLPADDSVVPSTAAADPVPPAGTPAAPEPLADDVWAPLRHLTPARIGIGRAGDALRTGDQLALRLAHARARDAVHRPLDLTVVREALGERPMMRVSSAAPDRATYLQRPDLGRRLADGESAKIPRAAPDLAFVMADGLSPLAVQTHAARLIDETTARLPDWSVGPVVVATQARVAIGDEIGAAMGAMFVVVVVGERPGLSAADSLGVYLTFEPRTGRRDSERNCISNVRPPVGLSYEVAADKLVALLAEGRRRGLTGVDLKDEAPTLGT